MHTKKIRALSDNRMAKIAVHTKKIQVLSAQNNHQMAEIEHLRVTLESHMKLQNQTMERELPAARS